MGSRSGWQPAGWALGGRDAAAVQAPALQRSLRQLHQVVAGQALAGGQLRVLLAPPLTPEALANGSGEVSWYCLGPGARGYRALARCRRGWRGWQVSWQLHALETAQLRQALATDAQASMQVFGRLRGQRLYA